MNDHEAAAQALLEEVARGQVTIVKHVHCVHKYYGDERQLHLPEPDRDWPRGLLIACVLGALGWCAIIWAIRFVMAQP